MYKDVSLYKPIILEHTTTYMYPNYLLNSRSAFTQCCNVINVKFEPNIMNDENNP